MCVFHLEMTLPEPFSLPTTSTHPLIRFFVRSLLHYRQPILFQRSDRRPGPAAAAVAGEETTGIGVEGLFIIQEKIQFEQISGHITGITAPASAVCESEPDRPKSICDVKP